MKDIQQLIKKNNQEGRYNDIFPKTYIDAIRDKKTGMPLTDILSGFNMYFLSYVGSFKYTRLQVPELLRKTGLWITYVKYDKTVTTEWYAGDDVSDEAWGLDSNWRIGSNMLVGDITISSEGNWVINGVNTKTKAQGEQGITPILRIYDNKLQVSYTNGSSFIDVDDNIVYTKFRVYNNKLQVSTDLGNTWNNCSDYIAAWFRWNEDNKIQISRTNLGTDWQDLSESFENNLYIKDYVESFEELPNDANIGSVYMVGISAPYTMYVKTSSGWKNNGQFTSITAGVVQNTGTSESLVMSQKAVTEEFEKLQRVYDGGRADTKYGGARVINCGGANPNI